MIKFLTPLNTLVTTTDLSTFFEYAEGSPSEQQFVIDNDPVPDIDNVPYTYIVGTKSNDPVPPIEYPDAPYGASRVYCNNSNMTNLPYTKEARRFNPIIKYKVEGNNVKICLYTKQPVSGDSGYQLYNDSTAQEISFITNPAVNNSINTGNYVTYVRQGSTYVPKIDGAEITQLGTGDLVSEQAIVDTLNSLVISKAWVEQYVKEQLEIIIPKAVDQAVNKSEAVIQQRYVSR